MAKINIEMDTNISFNDARLAIRKIMQNRAELNDCEDDNGLRWTETHCFGVPNEHLNIRKKSFNNFSVTVTEGDQ